MHADRLAAIVAYVCRSERRKNMDGGRREEEKDLLTLKDTGPNCLRGRI